MRADRLPRILLIDWDDEFAAQLQDAAKARYQVEHLISAPELQQAVQLEPEPIAILLDIDTFRLGTETRLLDLRRLLPKVVYVMLSRAPQVMMELSLDMGPALMVHKDNSLKLLLEMIEQLRQDRGEDETTESAQTSGSLSGIEGASELGFAQVVSLQRYASIGMLGRNLGSELNNMNTVLMSVLGELDQLCDRTISPNDEEKLLPVLLQDLSWVSANIKQYAESLVQLYQPQPCSHRQIDLKQRVLETLETLEGIGKTKYIGINTRLGQGDIALEIPPNQLDHILHNLIMTIANAVINNHATRRSVDITLIRDEARELTQLSFHLSAEFEHFRRLERALGGDLDSVEMLAAYVARRLIDANGGVMLMTPESHGGFSIHVEFPFERHHDVTSPTHYHDQGVIAYEAQYDEFVRQATEVK